MKSVYIYAALVVAFTAPVFAGTEMIPSGKDMKQVTSQIAPFDAGVYIAAFGGANFDTWYGDNRQTVDLPGGGTVSSHSPISAGWGGTGGIKIGYNFESIDVGMGSFRLQPAVEGEGLYIGTTSGRATNVFVSPSTVGFSSNSGAFFLNGILRFKNSSIVTPYIGAGVGLQYITTHGDYQDAVALFNNLNLPAGSHVHATGLDTSDLDFAGQALFGLSVQITSHISLFSEYKFIDAIGTDGKSTNFLSGYTYRFKPDQIQQNLITAGITYNF